MNANIIRRKTKSVRDDQRIGSIKVLQWTASISLGYGACVRYAHGKIMDADPIRKAVEMSLDIAGP